MKKMMLILLCFVLLAGFAACDAKEPQKESDSAIAMPTINADNATKPDVGNQPVITENETTESKPDEQPAVPETDMTETEVSEKPAIIENNVTDSADMMEVDSPIGTLYYPVKWKEDIAFQVNGNQFIALYYDIPLFTLYFGGDKGYLYGTVTNDGVETELRYEMHDLDSEHAEYETMSIMQEDINIIFQYLTEEGKLTVAD